MCSFNACKYNKELYNRIVTKGKSKKIARLEVCNKLLKKALVIAKMPYDENNRSILVNN